jgi:hypothetical protein
MLQPAREFVAGNLRLGFESNALAFRLEERLGIFKTESAGKLGVVPEDGMDIEREMGAVEGKIVPENLFEHAPAAARDRLQARPEQAVVDNEEVHAAPDGKIDRADRGIDGRAYFRDRAGILDLQTVQGIRPIIDLAKAQMFVRIGDDLREGSHGRDSE